MKKSFTLLISLFTLLATWHSSQAQTELLPVLPDTQFNYANPPLPAHFTTANIRAIDTTPANNPTTNAGATLGRVLFYDKNLSLDNSISCASCHSQSRGFSDRARLSVGFAGGLTGRHSMGLSNARYYNPNRFFWDERASSLENQTLQPIQDPVEMGETLTNVVVKLSATDHYPDLFEDAFGTSDINSQRIANSLAQFIRSMVSYRSKFDAGVAINFSNFTAQEQQGRQLFNSRQTSCRACHSTNLQTLDQASNNGLDAVNSDDGAGNGRFKSPSLRNVAVRAPFMHDGRFNTLDEVVNFYNSGIQNNPNLDNRLRNNGQPVRMNLDASERAALVAFLNTLTDTAFLNDAAFSDPFQLVTVIRSSAGALAPIISLLLNEDTDD
jgi:cytochrome c peroxidase